MPLLVVMGVSGSGKSTIAQMLAHRLSCPMLEGDRLHSAENIGRMAAGQPLSDADRHDWLLAITQRIADAARAHHSLVIACSALKRRYRDVLRGGCHDLTFIYLCGSKELIKSRLESRRGHFMSPALLDSQFSDLEEPGRDERTIRCAIDSGAESIVASVAARL